MTIIADLHTHTTATDGRATPAELIRRAAAAGLTQLVITDHSTVVHEGLADLAAAHGITLPFPGVEVSTELDGRRYHVVCYGPGVTDPGFQDLIRRPVTWKNEIAERVRAALVAAGHPMPDLETVRVYGQGPDRPTPEKTLVSRSALAHHLAAGSGLDPAEAYGLVRDVHRELEAAAPPGTVRYLPTLDLLTEATRRGIATTVAHPLWRCREEADVAVVCADLGVFRDLGLVGLETRSYHHRPFDDHPALLDARRNLGLVPSGGSDYHGNGRTELGVDGLDAGAFERFAAAVWERARD